MEKLILLLQLIMSIILIILMSIITYFHIEFNISSIFVFTIFNLLVLLIGIRTYKEYKNEKII